MEKEIQVSLDFFILSEGLKTDSVKKGIEIHIDSYEPVIAVNRLPFYKAKIIEESELILGKITKILNPEEALLLKEKYAI